MKRQHHDIDMQDIAEKAMEKYGFLPEFPLTAIDEARDIRELRFPNRPRVLKDLRGLLWSSIDNSDSMDLDQIEYCEMGDQGEILVRIAIADVDVYVPKGSQIDRYASYNGTAVYTGVVTFTMLPRKLSYGISSLLPGRQRMAIVIEYTVLPDGSTRHGAVYHAVVSNKAKLVYEEIGDWLEGKGSIPPLVEKTKGLEQQVLLQQEAALRLKQHRLSRGALELETLEAQVVPENGSVVDIVLQEQNSARKIIEEFMVAANETLVNFLEDAGVAMIHRVVCVPEHWDGIVKVAEEHGETLPPQPDAKALSRFLIRQKEADPERFPDLSLGVVKLVGSGLYVAYTPGQTPVGHFALAVNRYTHGTAPNRRYVDLVIQRLVKSILDKEASPYSRRELDGLAEWLSDREKGSEKVERFMLKVAAAVLLADRIGDQFDAIVTGASEKGTYVRIMDPPVEGRVMRGEEGLYVGQKIRVRLILADPYNAYIDFENLGSRY